ncbi:MAG TPA: cardiolipin synthase [Thermoanaerobaculia bacterium]|jgi:cardiolipin synthase|nr:cardiolipin synthase [Thermoanaerobaculia bacterium]
MNPHLVSTTILVTHWLIVVGLTLRVITRRAPVGVSVAWIAVMFSVPFIGAAVYLLFGEKRLGRRRGARTASTMDAVMRWQASLRQVRNETAAPLDLLAERVLGFPVQTGNDIELLDDFNAIFDAIVADIDSARETCHLSFYIWHERGRTIDVADALVRAARRGVQCRALADAMGSKQFLKGDLVRRLRQEGVQFRAALPTGSLPTLFSRVDLRNHRKIVVVDDRVAYTGSQNLADPRFFMQDSGAGEWVDAMIRVTGPAVAALDGVFAFDWSVETGDAFDPPTGSACAASTRGTAVQVAPSGPGSRPEAIHQLLLTAIYAARHELIMTTPYFVPDESTLTALLSAALRGVNVTLIVPAYNNSLLVRYASAAQYDDLLSAGAHVALFKGGLLHTKSLAIDGETSIFGSVNLDMRSLWLNSEISLFVYDSGFTGRLRSLQKKYLDNSEYIDLDSWRQRPRWRQLTENSFRLLGPLL